MHTKRLLSKALLLYTALIYSTCCAALDTQEPNFLEIDAYRCPYSLVEEDSKRVHHVKYPIIIMNSLNLQNGLPRNFRTTNDLNDKLVGQEVSLKGLADLRASGSSQFSVRGLKQIIKKIAQNRIIVVDLRQESHAFLNRMAITWFCPRNWINKNKEIEAIQNAENRLIHSLYQKQEVTIYRRKPHEQDFVEKAHTFQLPVKDALSEEDLCRNKFGIDYFRLPVTDHIQPDDHQVDQFLLFLKNLPPLPWLHFHCSAGQGRTSTFLAMYDMILNAKDVSLVDILKRQSLLGGVNFLAPDEKNAWNYSLKQKRKKFLHQFYEYCIQNQDDFQQLWSEWLKTQDLYRS